MFRRTACLALVPWAAVFVLAGPAEAGIVKLSLRSPPISVEPYGVAQSWYRVPSPFVSGYVTGVAVEVVDEAGRAEPETGVMLHHAILAKVGQRDVTCPKLPARRFYQTGEDRTPLALPRGYGLRNRGGTPWNLVYMLMNHGGAYRTVTIRYTIRYAVGVRLRPVRPVWFDIRACRADPIFDVPGTGGPGSTYASSFRWRIPIGGYLVAALGHLHGGAMRLELADRTCRRTLFTSVPSWGGPEPRPILHEPGPSHMSRLVSARGLPIAVGHVVELIAVYDNSRPHPRSMGIMMGYVARAHVRRCPKVPRVPPDRRSRPSPPPVVIVHLLRRPEGPVVRGLRATWVGDYRFGHERVSIRRGTRFTWRFVGAVPHDVTLANGPVGLSSPTTYRGSYSYRFTVPGRYGLYCSLHPTRMVQAIRVR